MIEIIITIGIVAAAGLIFINNIRKKSKAGCDCGSCSSHCPEYKNSKK